MEVYYWVGTDNKCCGECRVIENLVWQVYEEGYRARQLVLAGVVTSLLLRACYNAIVCFGNGAC